MFIGCFNLIYNVNIIILIIIKKPLLLVYSLCVLQNADIVIADIVIINVLSENHTQQTESGSRQVSGISCVVGLREVMR